MDITQIETGQMVHVRGEDGDPGVRVGTVDHLEGDYLKLNKNDSSDGKHHWVPISLVSHFNGHAIYLNCTKDQFSEKGFNEPPRNISAA